MNFGNIYIPENIVVALILTNTIFTIICMVKTSKQKQQSACNDVDDAILDRLVSIVGDCCMKYMYEIASKYKSDDSKKSLVPEDILSYIEDYIKQKYINSNNDESKTYYKDLLNVFYSTYDSSRNVVINIITDPNMGWNKSEKDEDKEDISA